MLTNNIVKVAISNASYGYDHLYSYLVSAEMWEQIFIGIRVLVPFGRNNQKRIALVLEQEQIRSDGPVSDKTNPMLKKVYSIIDREPLLSEEALQLLRWLKDTTFCTWFDAFRTIIPSGLTVQLKQHYVLTGIEPENLSTEERLLLENLKTAKTSGAFSEVLEGICQPQRQILIRELLQKQAIAKVEQLKRRINDDKIQMLEVSEQYIDVLQNSNSSMRFSSKQKAVLDLVESNKTVSVQEACYLCNVTKAVITNLVKKNILICYDVDIIRPSEERATFSPDEIILSEEQKSVFDSMVYLLHENKARGVLLHGVTGSGKTSIFIKLIAHVVKQKRQVVMLIPEISLTPQILQQFYCLFGERVAVIHSHLSLSQRLNEYKRIHAGQADIVVGTRSAVFAPLCNIGLIIMDEEGERSYKSEASPRYHARDVAKKRCAYHQAVLVMASATPSVESYYYAQQGRYKLYTLNNRYSQTPLPEVTIIDMAENQKSENFSRMLLEEIHDNLHRNEQTLLLLNRRGFHTYVSCVECRKPLQCPNCSIPLTFHKANRQFMCHYCGYSCNMISNCPACGSVHLQYSGTGTQKIEEELSEHFPDSRILRMDLDTAGSRSAYEKNFRDFAEGKYDILLGTQMIAKGLNFPNVTLVGVISVDKILFSGDFRSYERTFSLITQVVGRSGRAEKPGRAILQTWAPDHYVLQLSAHQDYLHFFQEEIAVRKSLIYPPFCDICIIGLSAPEETKVQKAANHVMVLLRRLITSEKIDFPLRVLNPVPCTHYRINGKYRYQILMKCRNTVRFRLFLSTMLQEAYVSREFAGVTVFADINGDTGA